MQAGRSLQSGLCKEEESDRDKQAASFIVNLLELDAKRLFHVHLCTKATERGSAGRQPGAVAGAADQQIDHQLDVFRTAYGLLPGATRKSNGQKTSFDPNTNRILSEGVTQAVQDLQLTQQSKSCRVAKLSS